MFIALSKDLAIVLRKGLVVESLSAVVETVELFFSIGLRQTLGVFQSVVFLASG
jgi:hypothetical protein